MIIPHADAAVMCTVQIPEDSSCVTLALDSRSNAPHSCLVTPTVLCAVLWCGWCGWCGVVWVWCGVVWCVWCGVGGVVWCGVVWCGVVWCGVVWCGVVW